MKCDIFPSVLWHGRLGDRKGIRPVKSWVLVCWWLSWSRRRIMWPPAAVCAYRRDEPPGWGVHYQSLSRRVEGEYVNWRGVCSAIACCAARLASRKQLLSRYVRKSHSGVGRVLDKETEPRCWLISLFRLSTVSPSLSVKLFVIKCTSSFVYTLFFSATALGRYIIIIIIIGVVWMQDEVLCAQIVELET